MTASSTPRCDHTPDAASQMSFTPPTQTRQTDAGSSRGQSNLIGYVLLFGLSAVSISALILGGVPAVEQSQLAQADQNTVAAFEVLDSNINAIHRYGSPSRTTEVRLTQGRLEMGPQETITVETANGDSVSGSPRPIIYEGESDVTITYVSGMITQTPPDGTPQNDSFLVSTPDVEATNNVTIVPLIVTAPVGVRSATGSTVQLRKELVRRGPVNLPRTTTELTVTVNSTRAEAWEQLFRESERSPEFSINTTRTGPQTVEYTVTKGGDPFEVHVYSSLIDVFLAG